MGGSERVSGPPDRFVPRPIVRRSHCGHRPALPSQRFEYNQFVTAPRLLILYGTAGAGHRRAAEAVAEAARSLGAITQLLDVMAYTQRAFRALYVGGGLRLITRWPGLYGLAYRATDRRVLDRLVRGPRARTQQISTPHLLQAIEAFDPQAVVCTHFLAAELCAAWRRTQRLAAPLITVITDFEPHRMWQHAGTDAYCVPTADAAARLARDGVERERMAVTGIPIAAAFAEKIDRAAARRRLNLSNDRAILLIMGGGLGVGGLDRAARALLARPPAAQIVFITGTNRSLRRKLRALNPDWTVRGFVDDMALWLAAADVVISKAGGLAASELLAASVPTVVPRVLTGHEMLNAQYFASTGAAQLADGPAEAVALADALLNDAAAQTTMRAAAQRAARPDAAAEVARLAVSAARSVNPSSQRTAPHVAPSPLSAA